RPGRRLAMRGTPPSRAQPRRLSPPRRRSRARRSPLRSPGSRPSSLAGCLHELLEEALVLARLGLPQHPDDKRLLRILDPRDCAVLGPGDFTQAVAHLADALVVVGHDRAADLADTRRRIYADAVLRELAEGLAMLLVSDDVRQVLDEVAAARDVEHL